MTTATPNSKDSQQAGCLPRHCSPYSERQRNAFFAMGWQHVAMGPTSEIINKPKPRRLWLGVVRDIEATQAELKPLMARLERLNRERADIESAEFIAANNIQKQDVELSCGEGKPWFGTAWEFGKWLASHSKKVWAEWNGRIYHTTDLVNGRMPDMKGRTSDLAQRRAQRLPGGNRNQHERP